MLALLALLSERNLLWPSAVAAVAAAGCAAVAISAVVAVAGVIAQPSVRPRTYLDLTTVGDVCKVVAVDGLTVDAPPGDARDVEGH